eukprot:XP_001691424.1 predicted protein [Chlamydomonas reinhardtii]
MKDVANKDHISRVEVTMKNHISRFEETMKDHISRVEATMEGHISRVEETMKTGFVEQQKFFVLLALAFPVLVAIFLALIFGAITQFPVDPSSVMAQIMGAVAALMRVQFVSGTHAIASALYSVLRPGDEWRGSETGLDEII